jgi:hypothetical protein
LRNGATIEESLILTPALGRFVVVSFTWSQTGGADNTAIVFDEIEIVPLTLD